MRSERKYQFLREEIEEANCYTLGGKKKKKRNGFNRFQRVSSDVIFLSPRSLNYEIIIARAISKSKDT